METKKLMRNIVLILMVVPTVALAQVRLGNITEIGGELFLVSPVENIQNPSGPDDNLEVERQRLPGITGSTALGVSIGQIFFLGLGGMYGYRYAEGSWPITHQAGAFGQFRLAFVKRRVSPTIGCKGGYAFMNRGGAAIIETHVNNWDGFLLHPELGLAFKVIERLAITLNFGYVYNRYWNRVATEWANPVGYSDHKELIAHRFTMSLGFQLR